jgi:aspartyl-tRNA(Asn)/glutamyl-tRNA(Gln) amidotransferase subunit C
MSLSADEVKKISNLAKLHIEEHEISAYAQHLSTILNFVEQISQANTDGIEPMSHPLENMIQRMREDVVTEIVDREKFQALSANHEAGLYLVPLVIDEK